MNIQWYPGHMAKTRRQLEGDINGADGVIVLLDARIPASSSNPDIVTLQKEKPCLTVLGRADTADPDITALWKKAIPDAVAVNAASPVANKVIHPALGKLLAERTAFFAAKGQAGRAMRVLVLGIPNVGKSTLINTLLRRRAAKAEDRPGVTRSRQWFPMEHGFLLMDTPGLLWPKFDDPIIGQNLAFTGAIRDEIMDTESLAALFIERLNTLYPNALVNRYGASESLSTMAKKRGFLRPGGIADTERMALTLLDEFRAGKLGRLSLEKPG